MMFRRTRGSTSFIDVMLPLLSSAGVSSRHSKARLLHKPCIKNQPCTCRHTPWHKRSTSILQYCNSRSIWPFQTTQCMHASSQENWKWGDNTPRHRVWSLNCSIFWHRSLKGIQTVLRPPPRVMLVHCSCLLTRASVLRLNNGISVIGNSGDHCRRGRIESTLIYGDITHWWGVLTKEIRTLRRSERARLCHYHLADIPALSDVLQHLCKTHKAIKCTLQQLSARDKSNLNVTYALRM